MLVINVEKFPNTVYVQIPKSEELQRAVESFIKVTERGMTYVDRTKYEQFLRAVYKLDKDAVIRQIEYFDSQTSFKDMIMTHEVKTLKVSEIVSDDDEGICQDADSSLPSPKRAKLVDVTPTPPVVTFEDTENELTRCCFRFNRQVIDAIRDIKGREYKHDQRSWFIPKAMKTELLEKLHELNVN